MIDQELCFLKPHLDAVSSKTAIDVGCHKAELSTVLLGWGFRVIGLEPNAADPELKACLDRVPQLELYAIAASDFSGSADMIIGEHVATNSLETKWKETAFPDNFITRNEVIQVPTETLTSLLFRLGIKEVGFLKIDAEGHDVRVITGLFVGDVRPEIIMFECHHKFPNDLLDAFKILQNNGYGGFVIVLHRDDGSCELFESDGSEVPTWWDVSKVFFVNVISFRSPNEKVS